MSDNMSDDWLAKKAGLVARRDPFNDPEIDKDLKRVYNNAQTTKPSYYAIPSGSSDIGDVVEHLPFWVANAMKYLYRVEDKNDPISNLEKARECISREIKRRKATV